MIKPLTAMVVSLNLITAASSAQAEERLLIGATSTSSSHYSYFVAINQVINDKLEGITSSVVETGATMDNLRRMSRRQIDLGQVTTNISYQAYHGLGDFEGNPVDDIQLLWVYTMAPQNVVVREDAGVDSLKALDGVRFNPGMTGSASESTTEAVFDLLGISPDYARGSTSNVVSSIKDNRIAGYVKAGVGEKLDGTTMDIATFTPIKVLSLADEQADKLREEMKDIAVVDIPEGAGAGVPAYTAWTFGLAMHATPDLDEEQAYQIVKAIMEDEGVQVNAFPVVRNVDMAEMTLQLGTVPLHPGAARYYEEQGLEIPDNLMPVE